MEFKQSHSIGIVPFTEAVDPSLSTEAAAAATVKVSYGKARGGLAM